MFKNTSPYVCSPVTTGTCSLSLSANLIFLPLYCFSTMQNLQHTYTGHLLMPRITLCFLLISAEQVLLFTAHKSIHSNRGMKHREIEAVSGRWTIWETDEKSLHPEFLSLLGINMCTANRTELSSLAYFSWESWVKLPEHSSQFYTRDLAVFLSTKGYYIQQSRNPWPEWLIESVNIMQDGSSKCGVTHTDWWGRLLEYRLKIKIDFTFYEEKNEWCCWPVCWSVPKFWLEWFLACC